MTTISTGFSLANALVLAEASRNAYDDEAKFRARYEGDPTVDVVRFYDVDDTQAYLLTMEAAAVVAFRGTQPDDLKDWLTDADVVLTAGPLGMVHTGFLKALNDVWVQVVSDVRATGTRDLPLYFTGHSLGGALAVLATAKMLQMNLPVAGVYTFGQPRVGDGVFCRNYDSDFENNTFRFVNNLDIVPRVPPRILNYNHVGRFEFFDDKGHFHQGMSLWQRIVADVESFTSSATKRLEDLKISTPEGLADHAIDRYVANIEKNLPRS
jgi:triacylglycerol lipase